MKDPARRVPGKTGDPQRDVTVMQVLRKRQREEKASPRPLDPGKKILGHSSPEVGIPVI